MCVTYVRVYKFAKYHDAKQKIAAPKKFGLNIY